MYDIRDVNSGRWRAASNYSLLRRDKLLGFTQRPNCFICLHVNAQKRTPTPPRPRGQRKTFGIRFVPVDVSRRGPARGPGDYRRSQIRISDSRAGPIDHPRLSVRPRKGTAPGMFTLFPCSLDRCRSVEPPDRTIMHRTDQQLPGEFQIFVIKKPFFLDARPGHDGSPSSFFLGDHRSCTHDGMFSILFGGILRKRHNPFSPRSVYETLCMEYPK